MFSDGWALFLDCQDLPGGTLMIKGKLLSSEVAIIVEALRVADNKNIRSRIGQP